jgi:hypothetical protein
MKMNGASADDGTKSEAVITVSSLIEVTVHVA